MLRDNGGRRAVELLEKWTGKRQGEPEGIVGQALSGMAAVVYQRTSGIAGAETARGSEQNHWTYPGAFELFERVRRPPQGVRRGAVLFEKAQCVKCHRYGDRGDTVGSDLTNVSRRFQQKEILESILFPSQVISDQYASQIIVTKRGRELRRHGRAERQWRASGAASQRREGDHCRERRGRVARNKVSAMPDGLLNALTLDEIADLFAYLAHPPRAEVTRRPARVR